MGLFFMSVGMEISGQLFLAKVSGFSSIPRHWMVTAFPKSARCDICATLGCLWQPRSLGLPNDTKPAFLMLP